MSSDIFVVNFLPETIPIPLRENKVASEERDEGEH